ncbi:hypothetical protein C8J57DRAFT_1211379 [Mycena rebaudengoi]|nr:hypothetical protein C8J57DRAFT_1211379 [Mycena rebaudengoi]
MISSKDSETSASAPTSFPTTETPPTMDQRGRPLRVRPSFLAAPQSSYFGVEQDSTGQEIHHAVLLNAHFLMHNPVTGQLGSISGHAQVKFLAVPEVPQVVWNVEVLYVADAKIQDVLSRYPTTTTGEFHHATNFERGIFGCSSIQGMKEVGITPRGERVMRFEAKTHNAQASESNNTPPRRDTPMLPFKLHDKFPPLINDSQRTHLLAPIADKLEWLAEVRKELDQIENETDALGTQLSEEGVFVGTVANQQNTVRMKDEGGLWTQADRYPLTAEATRKLAETICRERPHSINREVTKEATQLGNCGPSDWIPFPTFDVNQLQMMVERAKWTASPKTIQPSQLSLNLTYTSVTPYPDAITEHSVHSDDSEAEPQKLIDHVVRECQRQIREDTSRILSPAPFVGSLLLQQPLDVPLHAPQPYAPIPTLSPLVLDDGRPLIDLGAVANFQCSLLSPSPLALDPPKTTLPSTTLLPAAAAIGDTTKLLGPVSVRYRQPLADGTPVRVENWLHSQSSLPDPDMPELESVSDSDYQSGTELRPVNCDSVHGTPVSPQAYDSEDIASSDKDGEEPSFNDPHSAADISVLISDEASSTHGMHGTNGREDFAIVNTHEILEEISHVRTVPATATGSLLQDREVALRYTVQWAGTVESDWEDVLDEEDTDGLKPLEDGMHILMHWLNHTLDHSTMLQEDVGHLKRISDMPRQTGEDYARISPILDLGSEMVVPGKRKVSQRPDIPPSRHGKHKRVHRFNQSALQKSPIQLAALKIEYMHQRDDISGYTDVRLCILEAIRRLLIIAKRRAYNLDLDTLPNADPEFPPLPFRYRETNSLSHMLHAGLLKTSFPVNHDSVDGSESELSDDDDWYPGIVAWQDQEQFDAEYTAPSRFTIRAHHPLADGSRHSTSPTTPGPGTTVADLVPKSDGPPSPTPALSLAIKSAAARTKQLATTRGANTRMCGCPDHDPNNHAPSKHY